MGRLLVFSLQLHCSFNTATDSEGDPKTINEEIGVMVLFTEPCLGESHDATVLEVLVKVNIPFKLVHFLPQGYLP